MTRTENPYRSTLLCLLAALAVTLCTAGCSDKYEREDLGAGNAQRKQLAAMIQELRSAGPRLQEVIKGQLSTDLEAGGEQDLRALLGSVAKADSVEIKAADRFGKNICRTTLQLKTGAKSSELCVLLVVRDGKLYWAKRN